jgi:enoyl-CoA hydratase/carnithine racemase
MCDDVGAGNAAEVMHRSFARRALRMRKQKAAKYSGLRTCEANMTGSPTDELHYAVEGEIGIATFNRPAAHNALTFEMYDRLGAICASLSEAGPVKVLMVTGAGGRAFGAGTDIALFRDFRGPEDGLAYETRMEEVFRQIERCPVPTIAAIPGVCTGGAAVIAAACDLRLATRNLRYGFPIARTLANCLSGANIARVAMLTGVGRAMDMLLTTRLIEGEEALAIGLVSELLDTPEALMDRARALARQMATQAPLTMRAGKEVVRRMRERFAAVEDKDLIALCYGSADFREGLDAFLAKRKPRFTGR